MTPAAAQYQARMQRVRDHIDRHLDDDLSLDDLSAVAAFSRFHFHRQFTATHGISVHRYVQLLRLKRAAHRLAFRAGEPVTAIALDAGYDTPDAFGRVFRKTFGQSPTAFRKAPDWQPWHLAFAPLKTARTRIMPTPFALDQVDIITVAATPVAIMSHHGDPARIGTTIQRFIAWRRANQLPPSRHATFNIFHTDHATTDASDSHIDLCVATTRSFDEPDIHAGSIPGGRCATLRLIGSGDDLEAGFDFLYREWLPQSGEEARDAPPYCRRLRFFPDVAEHEAETLLFLPLQ